MNIILIYYIKYTKMTSNTNNNFLFFDDNKFANTDKEYKSGKYESPSEKFNRDLLHTYSTNKPKYLQFEFDNTDDKLKELAENIEKQYKLKKEFDDENFEKIKEMNDNKELLDKLEKEVSAKTGEIKLMEATISSTKEETQADKDARTINERKAVDDAKFKYNEVKKELDSLIIPPRIDPPRKSAPSHEKDKYEKYNSNRDNISNTRNKLTNVLRNKEIDIEVATKNLEKALNGPSKKQQLVDKFKQLRKEYDESIKQLNIVRNSYRDKLITKYKQDKLSDDINLAIEEKKKYERRGMAIITKKGTSNYDDNGNLIKKSKTNEYDMYKELENLENNLPMVEEKCHDIRVKTEFDFLQSYYNERIELINPYLPNINTRVLEDNHKWALESANELKDVKLQIQELKKKLYTGDVWMTVDQEKYNQMKQAIYNKYNFKDVKEPIVEDKKYTMDDFLKSIKKT